MSQMATIIGKAIKYIFPKKEYVKVSGSIIPSPDRRWCGPEFKDDGFYIVGFLMMIPTWYFK